MIEQKSKQVKTKEIMYQKLEMQDYLVDENSTPKLSKLIFKARTKMLDIKMQQSWKYQDRMCLGCGQKEETGDEILKCTKLHDTNGETDGQMDYGWFYSKFAKKIVEVGKRLQVGLKKREKVIEDGSTE